MVTLYGAPELDSGPHNFFLVSTHVVVPTCDAKLSTGAKTILSKFPVYFIHRCHQMSVGVGEWVIGIVIVCRI